MCIVEAKIDLKRCFGTIVQLLFFILIGGASLSVSGACVSQMCKDEYRNCVKSCFKHNIDLKAVESCVAECDKIQD